MYDKIVRKITHKSITTKKSFDKTMDHMVEPSLLPRSSHLLPSFPGVDWSNNFSRYLIKRVRRNPRDLHAHVQRTLLFLSKRDSAATYEALIDLFLILGKRGSNLRRNLLNKALPLLQNTQHQFLSSHMKNGLDINEPLPVNTFSSLSRGCSGTMLIVNRTRTDSNHSDSDPLERAMELINQNDRLTAMIILEDALHHDPGDAAVTCELLSLYKKTQARDAFYKTYTGLIGRCLALPELWCDTERFFLESTHTGS